MSKKRSMLRLIPLIILFFAISYLIKRAIPLKSDKKQLVLGVLKYTPHSSLDLTMNGFFDQVKKLFGYNTIFIVKEAEDKLEEAAYNLHQNHRCDAFFVLTTSAAIALKNIEKKRPIIAGAITDPKTIDLKGNICGLSDMIKIENLIEIIKKILPNIKTIALPYNIKEINSITMKNKIREKFSQANINLIEIAVKEEHELPITIIEACNKAEALLCPSDNLMASSLNIISHISLKSLKPLLLTFKNDDFNKSDALLARSIDYFEHGKKLAELLFRIITNKEKPEDIGFSLDGNEKTHINKKTLKHLKLSIPKSLENQSILIN